MSMMGDDWKLTAKEEKERRKLFDRLLAGDKSVSLHDVFQPPDTSHKDKVPRWVVWGFLIIFVLGIMTGGWD